MVDELSMKSACAPANIGDSKMSFWLSGSKHVTADFTDSKKVVGVDDKQPQPAADVGGVIAAWDSLSLLILEELTWNFSSALSR